MADLRTIVADLRSLAESASPGPWFFDSYSRVVSSDMSPKYDDATEGYDCVVPRWKKTCGDSATCHGCPFFEQDYKTNPVVAYVQPHHGDTASGQRVRDAEYLASLGPDVMVDLLDEIDRLRKIVEAVAAQSYPATGPNDDCGSCASIGGNDPANHYSDCPWRMAREAVGHA